LASSDLQLSNITHNALSASKVAFGKVAPFVIGVLNAGPSAANNATVNITWTGGALVAATKGDGSSCIVTGNSSVSCNLGTIPNGGSGTANLSLRALLGNKINVNALVTSDSSDPNTGNNNKADAVGVFLLPRSVR